MDKENLPREFGKYHLIERIASGGMAELYRAKLYGAGGFEKDLAIKKVLPHLAQDAAFVQMFMDEAMITVTLNHGNIVSVIDFGEINNEYFLVMEFIDGVDLHCLIRKSGEIFEPFPVDIACHLAGEICTGLDYAHRKAGSNGQPLKIVHRDVSPQNILISFEGEVKIVDFGIARAASRISSTQAGVLKGKVAYMSPEQILGEDVDQRSDIFAAGIMLYEMLTNHRPFEGCTPQETMASITRGTYEPPHRLNNRLPKRMNEIIKKALQTNAKRRYQTAQEMASDLSDFLHREGLHAGASNLASFIPKRLPEARPKAMTPTPVRPGRRDSSQPNITCDPPSMGVKTPQQTTGPKPAPLPLSFPPATAVKVSSTDKALPVAVTPSGNSPSAAATGNANNSQTPEAVSFQALGLPSYQEEPIAAAMDDLSILSADGEALPVVSLPLPAKSPPAAIGLENRKPMLIPINLSVESVGQTLSSDLSEPDESLIQEPNQLPVAIPNKTSPIQPTSLPQAFDAGDAWMTRKDQIQPPPTWTGEEPESLLRPKKGIGRWVILFSILILSGAALALWLLWPTPVSEPAKLTPAPPPSAPATSTSTPQELPAIPKPAVAKASPPSLERPATKPPAIGAPKVPSPGAASTETGFLRINSEPSSIVHLGSKKLGPTPLLDMKLPVGSHTLTLINDGLGITKRIRVKIEPNKTQTVLVELLDKK